MHDSLVEILKRMIARAPRPARFMRLVSFASTPPKSGGSGRKLDLRLILKSRHWRSRRLTTGNDTDLRNAQKQRGRGPGEWNVALIQEGLVRDPLILAGLGCEVSSDDLLCRRGTKVVLRENYARKHGHKHLLGLIGILGQSE